MIAPRPSTRSAGFTLVEIIVTVAIVGLMLASVTQILSTVRRSRDSIHNIQEVQLAGPAIMDLIERDLRSAHLQSDIEAFFHAEFGDDVS